VQLSNPERRDVAAIHRRRRLRGVLACWVIVAGCEGPSGPPPPPGGGQDFVLDFARFQSDVRPVLAQYSCNTASCHGGGIRGTFELSPPEAPDAAFDFDQAGLQVDPYDPASSPLLVEPLSETAGGAAHSWKPFDSTTHPGYVAIRDWILAGEFQ
jgi:hypothetical protein